MKSIIENLNQWGGNFLQFVWPMLWQSSLLIAFVFALDLLLARRIRASVRYALWLAVLVKLLLPPTLALPTGAAWWLFQAKPAPAPVTQHYTVTYSDAPAEPFVEPSSMPMPVLPPPKLDASGWAMLVTGVVSAGLLLWLGIRWWQVTRTVRRAVVTDEFSPMLAEASRLAGKRVFVRLKIVEGTMSPAVCGLFRPVILLPQALAEKLSPAQLRVVLLHELFHLRRGDVWVNCAQALLQIVYWWHPLLWVANARIRRVREEAVDDAVMLALREEADGYAPTLLEVAKLAFRRPLLSLGLVGIMESRSALRQRIERLVDFRAPRRAGLTLASLCGVFVFSAVALPMGESPAPAPVEQQPAQELVATNQPPEDEVLVTLRVDPDIFIKNIKAQAAKSMISPTNDSGIILLDILRSEGVNTVPPHGIAFNTRDGEITIQNTAAQLDIVRQVVEQLNRADGKCELPLRHSTIRRPAVLVEASIYQLPEAEFGKIVSGLESGPFGRGDGACWMASLNQFKQLTNQMAASGYKPVQRPRIQTSSGMSAQFFVGTDRYGTELDCKPYVDDGVIDLLLQGRVVSDPAAGAVVTNEFHARSLVENHGGVVVRMENAGGHAESNLVICVGVQILKDQPVHFQQRLQKIINPADGTRTEMRGDGGARLLPQDDSLLFSRVFKIDTNAFLKNLQIKVPSFDWSGTTNLFHTTSLGLRFVITNAGVDLNSPPGKAIFLNEHDSLLYVKATEADLQVITPLITNLSPAPAGSFRERLQTIIKRGSGTNNDPVYGLFTRTYKVDTNVFLKNLQQKVPTIDLDPDTCTNLAWAVSFACRNVFANFGVNLESSPDKSVFYNDRSGILFVNATASDLGLIDHVVAELNHSDVPGALNDPQFDIKLRATGKPDGVADFNEQKAGGLETSQFRTVASVNLVATGPGNGTGVAIVDAGTNKARFAERLTNVIQRQPRTNNASAVLYTRTFKVETNTFYSGLKKQIGATAMNSLATGSEVAKAFLTSLGVNMDSPVGKTVFFNDKNGMLFVRATKPDLDTIDHAIQALNQVAPQIHIKVRFLKVPKGTFQPILSNDSVSQFTSIVSSPNARLVLHSLESVKGFEILGEPEATTMSGRQCQMRTTQVITVVTNFVLKENPTNGATSVSPQTTTIEAGPIFDVVPYVLSDGYTINLAVMPSLVEFLGYIQTNATKASYTRSGERVDLPVIVPSVRRQQSAATANVWDGQTLVIRGMSLKNTVKDKVPVLGNVPLMGRLFRSEHTNESDILVFVTASIVDSTGLRVHSEDELSFAQTKTPPQPMAK